MTKWLLWIVVVLAVLVGLRLLNIAKAKRNSGGAKRGAARNGEVETMVRCVRCGVYLPRAEATDGPRGPTCSDPSCASRR